MLANKKQFPMHSRQVLVLEQCEHGRRHLAPAFQAGDSA